MSLKPRDNTQPFRTDLGMNELGYHRIKMGFTTYYIKDSVISKKDHNGVLRQIPPSELQQKQWIQRNVDEVLKANKAIECPVIKVAPHASFVSEPARGTQIYSIGDKSYCIVYGRNKQNTAFGVRALREYDIFELINDQRIALDRNEENQPVIELIHQLHSRRCNAQRNRIVRESGHFQTEQYKKWARQNRRA